MPRFPGPWAYGAAGLGEGLAQGLMLGMQNRRQKREEERLKQSQALQLLMGIYKGAQDNPDMAQAMLKQMEPWLQKQGFQTPQLPTAEQQLQKQISQFKSAEQEIEKAFPAATPEQKLQIAAGIVNFPFKVARPQATAGAKWFVNSQGEMKAFSAQNPPPAGEGWEPYEKPGQPKAWEQPHLVWNDREKKWDVIPGGYGGIHGHPTADKTEKTPEVESKIMAMATKSAMGSRDWLRAKTQAEQQALIDKWADYYRNQMGGGAAGRGTVPGGPWKGGKSPSNIPKDPAKVREMLKGPPYNMTDEQIDKELAK